MDKLLKTLRRVGIVLSLTALPIKSQFATASISANTMSETHYVLKEVVITAKKSRQLTKEFMGFKLENHNLDTSIHSSLENALTSFTGPKVKITSLRRNKWNHASKHRSGRAVDFQFSHELIEWLVSDEGTNWRETHGVTFFIEGRPGSKKLVPYKRDEKYSQYVFENPNCKGRSGDHIHINL